MAIARGRDARVPPRHVVGGQPERAAGLAAEHHLRVERDAHPEERGALHEDEPRGAVGRCARRGRADRVSSTVMLAS